MVAYLRKSIRLSKTRLLPAIKKRKKLYPAREKWMRYLRILKPLGEIPLTLNQNKQWYLDGKIDQNSKTGAVYIELTEVGLNPESIWHKNESSHLSTLITLIRIISRLHLLIYLIVFRNKTIRRLDLVTFQVIVGYAAYKSFFCKHPLLKPIIVSDISPLLHMQWAGALAAGNEVMWWQDDYHHFKGFSTENYLPYECHYAAVLNELGMQTTKGKCAIEKVFKRKQTLVKPFRRIPNNPRVGFASNVLFRADEKQLKYIDKIRQKLGATQIYCRLHPNSKLHGRTNQPNWLSFAPKAETLGEFAKKVDLVIVGNSAVQLKLLCLGVPVVHIDGFDEFGFDLYKYCELGFSYGAKNLNALDINRVHSFYGNQAITNKLDEYVNVTTEIPSLEELPKHIKRSTN